ncbi:hypothetical protein ILYODFUR_005979 [Ilyodon furcidens]|uniref:Secreted protein n=1 Tax=Ilyodon furcidens TaxID=33524 RepID=A0ABV0SVK1_9TELE
MSLVVVVKELGLSLRLGTGSATLFVFLSWQHPSLLPLAASFTHTHTHTHPPTHICSVSPFLEPVTITGKIERTICNSVTFMTVHSLIRGLYFICATTHTHTDLVSWQK